MHQLNPLFHDEAMSLHLSCVNDIALTVLEKRKNWTSLREVQLISEFFQCNELKQRPSVL